MGLNEMFDAIERTRETANWHTAFGEPQQVGDNTIIPVAKVTYGFGLGFGRGMGPEEGESLPEGEVQTEGEGGGAGGAASARPMGAIVVTPESVYFEETADATKIAVGGFLMGGFFVWQVAKTLRTIFGRE